MIPLGFRKDKRFDDQIKATRGRATAAACREVTSQLSALEDDRELTRCDCGDRAHNDDRDCILDQCYPGCDCSRCGLPAETQGET